MLTQLLNFNQVQKPKLVCLQKHPAFPLCTSTTYQSVFPEYASIQTTAILELTVTLQWLGTSAANMGCSYKFKAQALAHTCQFQHSTNQAKLQLQNGCRVNQMY